MSTPKAKPRPPAGIRRGVTMIELMIGMGIMALLMLTLAAFAGGVYQSTEYSQGYGQATQHGRVVMDRINRTLRGATANEQFPGGIVVAETVSGWRFPDALVVWSPETDPADPDGLPRVGELVVICLHPTRPNELIEITDRGNTTIAPAVSATSSWQATVENLKTSDSAKRVLLTDLVRVATVPEAGTENPQANRGCVRFEVQLSPPAAEWDDYLAGNLDWDQINWAQSVSSSQTGLRQTWLRYELQLVPGATPAANPTEAMPSVPFLGSAALFYTMDRDPSVESGS